MEIKKHYKLYKDGKQWCCMALAAVAVSAGLIFGNPNVKADTTVTADPQTEQVVTPATDSTSQSTDLAAQEKAAQVKDNGNYGWLDSANVVNNGNLQVSGWQATNQAAGKDNRYVIAYDSTTNTELGRTKIEGNTARPDVAKAYPNVVNAKDAGYQATMNNLDWNKVKSVDDHLQIVSRYSDAANGEGDNVDSWSQPINLDKSNNAYLDNFSIVNNQLQVTGWNATNKALGKNNHYIILFDRTAGHELARQEATVVVRPDVAKVYPQVINAQNSGFNVSFSLANVDLSHELQIISRYSDAKDGEGNNINYWFAPKKFISNTSNQGSLDSFNLSNGELTVAGWHATDYSQVESNHYLILFDKSNNTQVASMKVTNVARPDVAKAYPAVQSAGQAGFNASFGKVNLTPDHTYQIVSRYSTLAEGNGDNGQSRFTDFWFAPVTLNQQAYSIDNFSATKDGFNVTGWVASDQAINKQNPYLILLNNGKEIARTKLSLTDRPDVARVYPSLYNSQKSGFNVNLKVDPAAANGTLKLLLRFAETANANANYSDQTSPDYPTNIGNFDNIQVTNSNIAVSGWRASNSSVDRPYEYLIVLDNSGKELYRQQITNKDIIRNDVQNAYPYVLGANRSGFQITLPTQENMMHKMVKLINRLTDDPNGNGNYIDFYSGPVSVFSGAQTEGKKTTTYNADGQIIAVYNDAEVISQLPELPTGCEITAVTMMLRYAGYNVNKIQLANEMPRSNNGDYGFVGNPFSPSGWWIFPTGIAPVVNHYVGHSDIMTGTSMERIKDKLNQGHLVVAWVANVNGFVNHALALTGYDANRLFYNNPWTGRKESMTYAEFYQHWNADKQRAISY